MRFVENGANYVRFVENCASDECFVENGVSHVYEPHSNRGRNFYSPEIQLCDEADVMVRIVECKFCDFVVSENQTAKIITAAHAVLAKTPV